MANQKAIEIPIRLVQADGGAAQQRAMAAHYRNVANAWAQLADRLDELADSLEKLPYESNDDAQETDRG